MTTKLVREIEDYKVKNHFLKGEYEALGVSFDRLLSEEYSLRRETRVLSLVVSKMKPLWEEYYIRKMKNGKKMPDCKGIREERIQKMKFTIKRLKTLLEEAEFGIVASDSNSNSDSDSEYKYESEAEYADENEELKVEMPIIPIGLFGFCFGIAVMASLR